MPKKTDSLAILFVDIAKSSQIYETLGNKKAQSLISTCLALLSGVTVQHNGAVIKTIGDELMCTFPNANDAVNAAIAMNQTLDQMPVNDKSQTYHLNIYVGLQYGQVIKDGNDVFGDAVNVASRMVKLAKQRQILTTEETAMKLNSELKSCTKCFDKVVIKGKKGKVYIYECVWEEDDITIMVDSPMDTINVQAHLELKFQDNLIQVDPSQPTVSIGRQSHNELVVQGENVSRSHAQVEYRRGKFFVIDKSTNGTYIFVEGKKALHLKREEAPLDNKGIIGVGKKVNSRSPEAIHFCVKH